MARKSAFDGWNVVADDEPDAGAAGNLVAPDPLPPQPETSKARAAVPATSPRRSVVPERPAMRRS